MRSRTLGWGLLDGDVGDGDQAIYQWRGSDVRNIVEFAARYPAVRTFTITVNRRSRPTSSPRPHRSPARSPAGWTSR